MLGQVPGDIYDAVVAGAGPAGSAVARDLAAQGLRVLLLEEHRQVGEPLHCAGLVTPRTLALAGVGDGLVINQVTGAFVHHAVGDAPSRRGRGQELALEGGQVRALAMDRVRFDRELAVQAEAQGALLWTGAKLAGIQRQGAGLALEVLRRGREERVGARLLVGADGVHSRVARWLGVVPPDRDRVVALGAMARLRLPRRDMVHVFVGQGIAPGFFAWIIPLEEGWARVGIATNDSRRPIHYLRALVEAFPQVFAGAEFPQLYGGVIPLQPLARTYGDNVLLVGDAAGQTKPTSGGGIYMGLVGAKHCAQAVAAALKEDDLSAASLARYQRGWQRELGGELRRGRDLRQVFLRLSDRDLERLLGLLRSSRLQRLIARHGDIDFSSHLFRRLVLAQPLLTAFVRLALHPSWYRPFARP